MCLQLRAAQRGWGGESRLGYDTILRLLCRDGGKPAGAGFEHGAAQAAGPLRRCVRRVPAVLRLRREPSEAKGKERHNSRRGYYNQKMAA